MGKPFSDYQSLVTNRLALWREEGEATGEEGILHGRGYARLPRPYPKNLIDYQQPKA